MLTGQLQKWPARTNVLLIERANKLLYPGDHVSANWMQKLYFSYKETHRKAV